MINLMYFLQVIISGILIGGVYALVTVGLTMIVGVIGIINFAHGELLMLGMYSSFWLYTLLGLDPIVALPITIAFLFIIGYSMQKVLIQRIVAAGHSAHLTMTLGISLFLQNFVLFLWGADFVRVRTPYWGESLVIGGMFLSYSRLFSFIVAAIICFIFYLLLSRTDIGKAMRAVEEDTEAASLVGINIRRIYAISFGLGSALAGAGGALLSSFYFTYPTVGTFFVITSFVVLVLGGLGNFSGALFAGILVGVIQSSIASYLSPEYGEIIMFIIFILVLLFKPLGLFGKRRI